MPKTFPYLEISGSYHEVGTAIGATFKDKIQQRITYLKEHVPSYHRYLDHLKPYYLYAFRQFPNLLEELESTARAAYVAVEDYFFLNAHEVYHRAKPSHSNYFFTNEHCTIAVSFNTYGAIIGHNEDWISEEQSDLYVLKATVQGTTFLGLQYCTELAGVSASLNSWGLTQCINDLNPVIRTGVPKNFLARAVLQCKTLDEAQQLIERTPRASGFNHVLVQGTTIRNLELTSEHVAVKELDYQPYVHTNHYLSEKIKHHERFHSKSSEKRLQTAQRLVKNHMTENEMMNLLAETEQSKFFSDEPLKTIASVIIIPTRRELRVCVGVSNSEGFTSYQL